MIPIKNAREIEKMRQACRTASDVLDRVRAEAKVDITVLPGEDEARLTFLAVRRWFGWSSGRLLVFDIGGGSSELVRLGRCMPTPRGPPKPTIEGWVSIPLGVVTLAERHGGHEVTRAVFEAMVAEVTERIGEFAARHGGDLARMHMLGTSGTVTTIAGVFLRLKRYDRRRVDGCWLSDQEISGVIAELMAMSFDERAANPCIGAERADLVLAGCAILEAILRMWPCERLRVADRGLREGILTTLMVEDGVLAPVRRRRRPA